MNEPIAVSGPPAGWVGRSDRDQSLERRLLVLMGARLGVSLLSLGVTLALEAAGEQFTTAEWRGFYATIAFAFAATIAYGLVLNRVIHPLRFAALNVVTDIAIVTRCWETLRSGAWSAPLTQAVRSDRFPRPRSSMTAARRR